MQRTVTSAFTTASWAEREVEGAAHAPCHALLTYGVSYFGEVSGTSWVSLLTINRPDGSHPYSGYEFFEGTIGPHRGMVVFEHHGEIAIAGSSSELRVVSGTATGSLADVSLSGRVFVPEDGEGMIAVEIGERAGP